MIVTIFKDEQYRIDEYSELDRIIMFDSTDNIIFEIYKNDSRELLKRIINLGIESEYIFKILRNLLNNYLS